MDTNSKEKAATWERFTKYFQSYPEIGLSLDISRMHFDQSFLSKMTAPIESALKEMKSLESGAIANPDESRMVGHYWLRESSLAPSKEIEESIEALQIKVKDFASEIHSGKITSEDGTIFTQLLLIGIGGSALGPQLVADALGTQDDAMQLHFSDNTDPDGIARTLSRLEGKLSETLCLVVSKSGGTPETRNGFLEIEHAFSEHGLNFAKHAVAITGEGSKLDTIAKGDSWIERFYMWDWVGGRTSLFSAVGLLPAALQGVNTSNMLAGAKEMDDLTRNRKALENPAALLALMWWKAGEGRGKKDMVVLPYKDRLSLFSKYLQQLVMESLGKEKDRDGKVVHQGIAVYGNKGSTDQHAYVQQLRDGLNNFFATFIEVLADESVSKLEPSYLEVEEKVTSGDYLSGFFQGTRNALSEGGRESITITIDRCDARSLGHLIALYERAVGLYASLINVNAYNQPGVESGKKAAALVIELQKKILAEFGENKDIQALSASELATRLGSKNQVETIYKILEHLAANPNHQVTRASENRNPLQATYKRG